MVGASGAGGEGDIWAPIRRGDSGPPPAPAPRSGYLLTGVVAGPFALGMVSQEATTVRRAPETHPSRPMHDVPPPPPRPLPLPTPRGRVLREYDPWILSGVPFTVHRSGA